MYLRDREGPEASSDEKKNRRAEKKRIGERICSLSKGFGAHKPLHDGEFGTFLRLPHRHETLEKLSSLGLEAQEEDDARREEDRRGADESRR